ncbi:hypothetical protein Tco_0932215 [Tanacetum coccineum]
MLDRTDFESWQQRIRLYCLGKDNGENIIKSIKEGPFQMGTSLKSITGGTEGAVQQGPVRARVLKDTGEAKTTSSPTSTPITQAQVTYVSESVLSLKFDAKISLLRKKVEATLKSAWTEKDQIDNLLKERRLIRSLEMFVDGRLYEGDLRRLQKTI